MTRSAIFGLGAVGDEQHPAARLRALAQQHQNALLGDAVQFTGRLVREEDVRVVGQSDGQAARASSPPASS